VVITPVRLFFTSTVAPGITPPLASTTTPESVVFVLPWANAIEAKQATIANVTIDLPHNDRSIEPSRGAL
jgi:hypothetical protein